MYRSSGENKNTRLPENNLSTLLRIYGRFFDAFGGFGSEQYLVLFGNL